MESSKQIELWTKLIVAVLVVIFVIGIVKSCVEISFASAEASLMLAEQGLPQSLYNVRERVNQEYIEFLADWKSDSPYFQHQDNVFFALIFALQAEEAEAGDLADAIDTVENFARELRSIQSGKKGFENDR